MAMKDWEKQRENKNLVTWTNQVKRGELLEINQRSDGKWRVVFIENNEVDVLKQGISKSQAMAYARSYMRNH